MSTLAQLQPGVVFAGDFRVIGPLREGGMGAVYVVEQLSTSKQRALKVMLPELVAEPSLRRRFEAEARVGARIRSDHVVEVIASGVDAASGAPWLVMELLEGEDLEAHARRRGPLPPAEVQAILEQLCHALGAAHREGIVHRDLKPENIFLAAPRRAGISFMVKVLDFGIARIAAEARTTSSATTAILGTPLWMAPEQAQPGALVTPAADVWALGLIVYRLLTGRCFWRTAYAEAPSLLMLMNEAFVLPMPSASRRAAEDGCAELVPAGFDAWFERCTSRDPGARFEDATRAFEALGPVLAGQAEVASAPAIAAAIAPAIAAALAPVAAQDPAALGTAATQVVVQAPAPVVPASGGTPAPLVTSAPGRARTPVIISVVVTVTVGLGAMMLGTRSWLTLGRDEAANDPAVTAEPIPVPPSVAPTPVVPPVPATAVASASASAPVPATAVAAASAPPLGTANPAATATLRPPPVAMPKPVQSAKHPPPKVTAVPYPPKPQ